MTQESDEATMQNGSAPIETTETTDERVLRLRAERDRLQLELDAERLEREIDQMRRIRGLSHPSEMHAPPLRESTPAESTASSWRGDSSSSGLAVRPKLREPKLFTAKSIKEARNFLQDLEVIFALSKGVYTTEQEKVLYGVMFLAGDAHETWHRDHRIDQLGNYTFDDFKEFVRDAVEDPANRMVNVTVAYERAHQKEDQTAQNFANELAILEDQMEPYTEPQRVRHLLGKLRKALRDPIIKYHALPKTRQELVALASRLEATDRSTQPDHKRVGSDLQGQCSGFLKKRRQEERSSTIERNAGAPQAQRRDNAAFDKSKVECYGCHKKGHYKNECKSKHLWSEGESHSVRKVGAIEPAESGKAKG